jgi:hypothetical protein
MLILFLNHYNEYLHLLEVLTVKFSGMLNAILECSPLSDVIRLIFSWVAINIRIGHIIL